MRFAVSLSIMLTVLSGLAQADTREYEKQELARFERYAGEPIEQFPMFELWEWQVVGPTQLVVWSTIKDAYLLRVDRACNNLQWTHGLSVTQQMRQKVSQKFDFVVFRNERCKIIEIRPIDYQAMRKDGYKGPSHDHAAPEKGAQASGGT